ncbi:MULTISPECIES: SDR family NAD(P)-dependent oxidoreductase [Streptomyces]|uniref:SDR family oxidoreductase n=1 Tax=Streptomyces flaveolus TaxID=67297 RepID=A0ABV3ANY0_9ACTN|nr:MULTISPECIES: SDR family oxidoreductase [Streptomyces]KOG59463.1 oxidoreductase [Streptomyces antibioticus]
MQIDLSGRTALVTGSTAGIGEATARALAAAGADVVVNGRNADRVAETAERIGGRGVTADVGTAEGTADLIRQLPDADILVNNTGVFETRPVFEITDADWLRFYEVNVLSGVRLARHYAPRMVGRGWGRVIFVSSEAGVQTPTDMVHYGMTKTAQLAVSRGMAQEVAGTGVTVNCVLPGPTMSDGVLAMFDELYPGLDPDEQERRYLAENRAAASLLKRLIRPHEVASMITYVASEHASATTGRALGADGGLVPTIVP